MAGRRQPPRAVSRFGRPAIHQSTNPPIHESPAIVCRFKEQTTKGFMWRNPDPDDWLFDLDRPEQVERLTPTGLAMATAPKAATAKARAARTAWRRCTSEGSRGSATSRPGRRADASAARANLPPGDHQHAPAGVQTGFALTARGWRIARAPPPAARPGKFFPEFY